VLKADFMLSLERRRFLIKIIGQTKRYGSRVPQVRPQVASLFASKIRRVTPLTNPIAMNITGKPSAASSASAFNKDLRDERFDRLLAE
jgi:hypothetical protein